MSTTTTDNAGVVRGTYDAIARGDVPAVLDVLDPEVVWTEAEGGLYGGTYRGPQEVLEGVFGRLGAEWDGFSVETDRVVAAGDLVAVTGTYRGSYRATGRAMDTRFAHIWEMRNGRLVRFEQVVDSETMNAAAR